VFFVHLVIAVAGEGACYGHVKASISGAGNNIAYGFGEFKTFQYFIALPYIVIAHLAVCDEDDFGIFFCHHFPGHDLWVCSTLPTSFLNLVFHLFLSYFPYAVIPLIEMTHTVGVECKQFPYSSPIILTASC